MTSKAPRNVVFLAARDPHSSGGFVPKNGKLISAVVNPGHPVFTFPPKDFHNIGNSLVSNSLTLQPIPAAKAGNWNDLMSQLFLQIFPRLNAGGGNFNGIIPGNIEPSAVNLKGKTFVRTDINGSVMNRLAFANDMNYVESNPSRAGSFAVTPTQLTLTPSKPPGAPQKFAISAFQTNANGQRSIRLDANTWNEELTSPGAAGATGAPGATGAVVASDSTLRGKVFVRKDGSLAHRLTLGKDGSFQYLNAPLAPPAAPATVAAIGVTKGTFSATPATLAFTPDAASTGKPLPGTNQWTIGAFKRDADGKHTIVLNNVLWEEESLVPNKPPLGPIDGSLATLGNTTFSFTDSGVVQTLVLNANGQFVYRLSTPDGSKFETLNGSYTVSPIKKQILLNPSITTPPPDLKMTWDFQNFQMNADAMSIQVSNLSKSPAKPSTQPVLAIKAPMGFSMWKQD